MMRHSQVSSERDEELIYRWRVGDNPEQFTQLCTVAKRLEMPILCQQFSGESVCWLVCDVTTRGFYGIDIAEWSTLDRGEPNQHWVPINNVFSLFADMACNH